MKRVAGSEPIVVIEWNGQDRSGPAILDACILSKDDLLALARALGRLAARRDLARGADGVAPKRLSSGAKAAKMKVKVPVSAPASRETAE